MRSQNSLFAQAKGIRTANLFSDAFVNFSPFEGRGDANGDRPERVESGPSLVGRWTAGLRPKQASTEAPTERREGRTPGIR